MIDLKTATFEIFDNAEELDESRGDIYSFMRNVIRDESDNQIPIDDYTRIFVSTVSHCRRLGRHINHVSPPGLGKSTLARMILMFDLGDNPELREVIVSADEGDAQNSVTLCRSIIASAKFQSIFPEAVPDVSRDSQGRGWRMKEFFLKVAGQRKDPSLAAVAAQPKGESRRVDVGLFDDYITPQIVEMQGVLARYVRRFFTTWLEGRMANKGWALLLHNCQRSDDLAHYVLEDRRFCSFWIGVTQDCESMFLRLWNAPDDLPVLKNPDAFNCTTVEVSDKESFVEFNFPLPERDGYSPIELRQRDEKARQQLFHLKPMQPDDMMFQSWDKRTIGGTYVADLFGGLDEVNGLPVLPVSFLPRYDIAAGMDISSTKRKGCAFWIVARDIRTGKKLPAIHFRGAYVISTMIRIIDTAWQLGWKFRVLYVEDNAVQELIVHAIRDARQEDGNAFEWSGRVLPFTTTGQKKFHPESGLPAIDTEIKSGTIVFPREESRRTSSDHCEAWIKFQGAMATCPRFLGPGETDDSIMAFWFAWRAFTTSTQSSRHIKVESVGRSEMQLPSGF